jgi:hypothetical protein
LLWPFSERLALLFEQEISAKRILATVQGQLLFAYNQMTHRKYSELSLKSSPVAEQTEDEITFRLMKNSSNETIAVLYENGR